MSNSFHFVISLLYQASKQASNKQQIMSTRRSRKAQREKEVVEDVQEKDIVVHDNDDDEADEEEPPPASQARSSNQKKKRVGVLDESGLTDADRRRVRQQQRSLLVDLEERGLELEEARNRNNELYESVRYTREAVLDGENMIAIANLASQKVDRLIQVSTLHHRQQH